MNTLKKMSALLLALMLTLSMCMVSASAAETEEQSTALNITSTSNYFPSESVTLEKDKTFCLEYILDSTMELVNSEWTLTYDNTKLSVDKERSAVFMPEISVEVNNIMEDQGKIKGNFSDISNLVDFNGGKTLIRVYFDIIGTGDATVNLDLTTLCVGYYDSDFNFSYKPVVRRSTEETNVTSNPGYENLVVKRETKITELATGATVYFAAPRVAPGRTVWSDVDIYYGDTTSVIKSNRIHMTDTGLVVDNPSGASLKTTRRGNWHVFSADLTADQIAAIDSAKYTGFVYANNYNLKTSAKFDIKMGGSIADFDGQVFLINGAVTNSEVDSYTGEWTTSEMFAPEYKATTLKFACPTQNWSGGVYFYYGDSSVITTVNKIAMTDSGKTYTVDDSLVSSLTKYVGGDWKVYTVDLTAEQVEIIDNSSVSGFCSGSSIYVKTTSTRNVFRDYNSVQDLANYTFVATNCTNSAQERASLTGKWRWCKL